MTTQIKEGEKVPSVVFKTRVRDESVGGENPYRWQDVTTDDLFEGKKVVVFSIPGAFTPICSSAHLPGYEAKYEEFKRLGVDEVYCTAVNDAFVMKQWADKLGVQRVKMLPDGNGHFAGSMGLLVAKENLGYGNRSWRHSMYVEDGVLKKLFVEPGMSDNCSDDPFGVADANKMLKY